MVMENDIYNYKGLMNIKGIKEMPVHQIRITVSYYLANVHKMNEKEIHQHLAKWLPGLLCQDNKN